MVYLIAAAETMSLFQVFLLTGVVHVSLFSGVIAELGN